MRQGPHFSNAPELYSLNPAVHCSDRHTDSKFRIILSLSLSLPVVGDNKGPHCPCIARKISTLLPIPGGTLRVAQTLAGDSRPKRNETTEHRVVPLSRSESIGSDICGLREVRGGGGAKPFTRVILGVRSAAT